MRTAIRFGALVLGGWVAAVSIPAGQTTTPAPAPKPATQTPAKPAPAPAPAKPAAKPAPRRPAAAAARAGMAITVTDAQGSALPDVRVEVIGMSERSGVTSAVGQINFTAMQAGTYRVRFSGDDVITFEREVAVRAGQVANVDVTLNAAPPPPPPPAAPAAPAPAEPAAPAVGPPGQPVTLSVVDLIEKEYVGNQPRRESLLSCSGNTRTTLVQLNQDQAERLYDTADATYYVVGGEGALRIEGRDVPFPTTGFMSIPRGTAHAILRRGRRPLILITTLSGTPCEETR
jgi:mannose-6-phosphate isomerase-like protein (cupin superfamily)